MTLLLWGRDATATVSRTMPARLLLRCGSPMTMTRLAIAFRIIVLLCDLPFSRYPAPVSAMRVGLPAGTCMLPPQGASPVLSSVEIGPVALPIPPVFSRKTEEAYVLN